jgi:hypothetical protein
VKEKDWKSKRLRQRDKGERKGKIKLETDSVRQRDNEEIKRKI